jgi:glycosyltransferase involved in cell wall biosynthesis
MWCGRLNDSPKNVGFFVDLAISLQKRLADFQCRVIGDGPLRSWMLRRLSEAGVKFDYTANIPPDKIADEFSQARMLALPSKLEAWGLVCNEAMQCGTPCTVSHFTGVADELVKDGDSGFVLSLNVAEWTQKIAIPVTDRLAWTKLSEAARRASAQFKLESSAEKYIEGLLFAVSARKSQYKGS